MGTIWVFYKETYQQVNIQSIHRPVTIGNQVNDTITIRSITFESGVIEAIGDENTNSFAIYYGNQFLGKLQNHEPMDIKVRSEEFVTLYYFASEQKEKVYYIGNNDEIIFSKGNSHAHIQQNGSSITGDADTTFTLIREKDQWLVFPEISRSLYVNGKSVKEPTFIENGDIIFWQFLTIHIMENDLLSITSAQQYTSILPRAAKPTSEMRKKYPDYRRTPRMVYELPDEKINLSFPHQAREGNQRGLLLIILPPLIMLLVMGGIALIQPRGLFMIISVVMFMTTIVTSTVQYFKEQGNRKRENEKRIRLYSAYLKRKREELQKLASEQKKILYYHYPSFEQMKYLTAQISERIWERSLDSFDFLTVRIGRANIPATYDVAVGNEDSGARETDELIEDFHTLVNVYKKVENVPLSIEIRTGAVGLIGKPAIVKNEIHQLIGQLAFFHSYHDVRFVAIFHEEEYKDWEWMRWLPHFQLPHMFAKGFVYNEATRDQLLSSIYELLRDRELNEDKDKKRFVPHFVFIVTNRTLISEHVILEYLEGKIDGLGISTIFAAESKESLSEHIHTLVRYVNESEGDILIQQKKAIQTPFIMDEHTRENNEGFARTLLSLEHQLGLNNSIPTKVSFLELFHAKDVKDLAIGKKWKENISSKSLAVPIGLKGKEDIVELNLHEKAHGPHGLLAGTTGSGKSEFLQTYILSLAVHFHPHDVAFLLIDYKGGGMAQPFKNLPHLLGTITNIEGSKNFSMRALASIKSELKRRQRLFDQYEVNHIHDYTNLYQKGRANDPLPHLFLISDEFAELKSEEPEFIRELVSAARIGRSLGVHLILATQKPGGVVDEQIWSNARFKVALKVQDANDSKEILKNSDAANITVTGRGYLQVGNNEVYELFQSAWSGAPYLDDAVTTEDEVAIVTDLGLNPLSVVGAPALQNRVETKSEIEVVVKQIEEVQKELNIEKLPSPWLPPLKERIFTPEIREHKKLQLPIGLKDEPEKQQQSNYYYQPIEDGSIAIIGTSGYGKSTTAITLLLRMAEQLTSEEVHYYLFDFGNGALLPIRQLPHTGDYFRMEDQRKIEKFMNFLKGEMERRKQLFEQKEISNIKLYNSINQTKLPLFYVVIDNFDIVRDEYPDLETQFIQLSRDGQSLGIYLLITATRVNSVRQSLMNNLKTKITHYLMDKAEVYTVLGRVPYEIEPIPGRAIVKKDDPYLMQVFLPEKGEDDLIVLENVKKKVLLLQKQNQGGNAPISIPMLPQRLDLKELLKRISAVQNTDILLPIGLDEETVTPVFLNIQKNKHWLILGPGQKGKTNVLKVLLDRALKQKPYSIAIFDGIDRALSQLATNDLVDYLDSKEQITAWIEKVKAVCEEREKQYLAAVNNQTIDQLIFTPIIFVVDSISRLNQTIDSIIQGKLADIMKRYSHLGFSVMVAGSPNEVSKGYDPLSIELKQIRNGLLLMKKSDQSLFTFPYERKEGEIQPGFGYYVVNGNARKIQIPLV
ncbi:type VII secretion protein EssC [Caldibacillus lycopersici]|uniref:Type VII secretion protein EssC n=1 Tax=Perspicuibacillus lycopersici TaxID=1325689 RepID=A0AAE3ISS6_9BACI|nr:type VII secretion protein EssC [Perspicuibacillus lycopersici]MCU9612784.1 type VII secretion protein EssC [Perspicuibacillus lycopersici]